MSSAWLSKVAPSTVGTPSSPYLALFLGDGTEGTTAGSMYTMDATRTVTAVTFSVEQAQDAVGSILTDTATIDFTYDDAGNAISAIVIDGSITNAKLANMAQSTIRGRAAGAGTGVPQDLTATQTKTILAITESDVANLTTDLAAKAPTSRLINTTAPITGGGDLSADRTLALTTSPAGQTPVGVTRQINTTAPITGGGDLSADRTLALTTSPTGQTPVGVTRLINTTAPITGGGDLSADRTLALTTSPAGQTPVGVTRQINTTSPLTGGGALSGDLTLNITQTGTGPSVARDGATFYPKDIEGVVYVDKNNTQGWSGSDVGAWINSAYAYLVSTYGISFGGPPSGFTGAGIIQVAPGTYTYTTPIVLADQWFDFVLRGAGEGMALTATSAGKGGTVLNYTPTSGVALTVGGASSNNGGVQLENFALFGGTVGTAAALPVTGTATGIMYGLTGGVPPPGSSTAGATVKNVAVAGFAVGEDWNSSGSVGYAVQHYNCKIQYCNTGVRPYGEANNWYGGLIANCQTGVAGSNNGTDAGFFGVAFDDNTVQAFNVTQTLFRAQCSACRFENAGGGTDLYITQTAGSLTILGGTMQSDLVSGTSTGFGNISGGVFVMRDTWLLGQGSRTFTQAFNMSSAGVIRCTPQIAPSSVGITTLFQAGFTDQGVIARNRGGVTSSTTETLLFNARIPGNAPALTVGTVFRIKVIGNSSSTGTLLFRVRMGTAGTVADAAVLWNPATSVAQVANHRSSLECLVYVTAVGAAGAVQADGVARYSNLFVEETTIAAPATSAVNTTGAWFLDITCACSVGTFTVDMATVEIL